MKCLVLLLILISIDSRSQDLLIQNIVHTLANDSMMGRAAGTRYERLSIAYLKKIAKDSCRIKLKEQKFELSLDGSDYISCSNLYGFINNRKKKTIVISAHFDHIGFGGKLSKALKDNAVHNGADDNASGVALVMAFAKKLKQSNFKDYNYLIYFYTAHELGLHGSAITISDSSFKKYNPVLHLNFDMVGRMRESTLKYASNRTQIENEMISTQSIQLVKGKNDLLENSDLKWSNEKGIPCLHFTTGIHSDYHKPSDDVQYIYFEGIEIILDYIYTNHLKWVKALELR